MERTFRSRRPCLPPSQRGALPHPCTPCPLPEPPPPTPRAFPDIPPQWMSARALHQCVNRSYRSVTTAPTGPHDALTPLSSGCAPRPPPHSLAPALLSPPAPSDLPFPRSPSYPCPYKPVSYSVSSPCSSPTPPRHTTGWQGPSAEGGPLPFSPLWPRLPLPHPPFLLTTHLLSCLPRRPSFLPLCRSPHLPHFYRPHRPHRPWRRPPPPPPPSCRASFADPPPPSSCRASTGSPPRPKEEEQGSGHAAARRRHGAHGKWL